MNKQNDQWVDIADARLDTIEDLYRAIASITPSVLKRYSSSTCFACDGFRCITCEDNDNFVFDKSRFKAGKTDE